MLHRRKKKITDSEWGDRSIQASSAAEENLVSEDKETADTDSHYHVMDETNSLDQIRQWFDSSPFSISTDLESETHPRESLPSPASLFETSDSGSDDDFGDRLNDFQHNRNHSWSLGLDIGTTGISAVLVNPSTQALFPIYWRMVTPPIRDTSSSSETSKNRWFRLPVDAVCDHEGRPSAFISTLTAMSPIEDADPSELPNYRLTNIKPILSLGIPYRGEKTLKWEPLVHWSNQNDIPLHWFQQVIQTLISCLVRSPSDAISTGPDSERTASPPESTDSMALTCSAVGLIDTDVQDILQHLQGIVVGCPEHWPDAYRNNIREALLSSHLINQPHQVTFVSEAIAILLSELRASELTSVDLAESQPTDSLLPLPISSEELTGTTLVISSGATVTELAIAHLPAPTHPLSREDLQLHFLDYAGQALTQDIINQVLFPRIRGEIQSDNNYPIPSSEFSNQEPDSNRFRLSFSEADREQVNSIRWPVLRPGHPVIPGRVHFQQCLHSSAAGRRLLTLAEALKIGLQYYEHCDLTIDKVQYTISRKTLGIQVFVPFMETLKESIVTLLENAAIDALDVRQVMCSGGTVSLRVIALWLRKRFPNATIIQDSYGTHSFVHNHVIEANEHEPSRCSRVAYGLAKLPLYPTLFEQSQRIDDYALLHTILSVVPEASFTVDELMDALAQQNIGGDRHRTRVLQLLQDDLPPGIQSNSEADDWLTYASQSRLLPASMSLFEQPAPQVFQMNPQAKTLVQHRLEIFERNLHCRYSDIILSHHSNRSVDGAIHAD